MHSSSNLSAIARILPNISVIPYVVGIIHELEFDPQPDYACRICF
jgi:hypothetical protein